MPYEMVHLLRLALNRQASDLTISPGTPPYVCVNGTLDMLDVATVPPAEAKLLFESIASKENQQCLRESGKADFAFWFENVARFRVTAVKSEGLDAPIMRLFVVDRNI